MSATFIALLSAYYLCDAAAEIQPLPPSTAQACAKRYEAVKTAFHPEASFTPDGRRIAYLRFKAWEEENAGLVSRMREDAADNARDGLLGIPF